MLKRQLDNNTITNSYLIESVFGIPLESPEDNVTALTLHMGRQAQSLIVQTKYFFQYADRNPVSQEHALKKFADNTIDQLKNFKYIYLFQINAKQFEMIRSAFKPCKKVPRQISQYDKNGKSFIEKPLPIDNPDKIHQANVEAIIVDALEPKAVFSLLEVLPPTVKKIGLTNVPSFVALAVQDYLEKNKLNIVVITNSLNSNATQLEEFKSDISTPFLKRKKVTFQEANAHATEISKPIETIALRAPVAPSSTSTELQAFTQLVVSEAVPVVGLMPKNPKLGQLEEEGSNLSDVITLANAANSIKTAHSNSFTFSPNFNDNSTYSPTLFKLSPSLSAYPPPMTLNSDFDFDLHHSFQMS